MGYVFLFSWDLAKKTQFSCFCIDIALKWGYYVCLTLSKALYSQSSHWMGTVYLDILDSSLFVVLFPKQSPTGWHYLKEDIVSYINLKSDIWNKANLVSHPGFDNYKCVTLEK